jgi:hypothetical protein
MTEKKTGESREAKLERWRQEHLAMVGAGLFDKIPQREVEPGEMVAVRSDNLIRQVYDVLGRTAIVGYDTEDEQVRDSVNLDDIRDAEGYQNALLQWRGMGGLKVTVEGSTTKLWDNSKNN